MSENVVPLEIPVDPDRYQELIRENQMLREEIRVSREAAEITAGLVVKQFEETERVLRRFEDANAMRKAVLDSAAQFAIIATNNRGIITIFNPGAKNLLGYDAYEVVHRHGLDMFHLRSELDERAAELSAECGRAIKGSDIFYEYAVMGRNAPQEWNYIRKDGYTLPVSMSINALRDPDGHLTGCLCIATDITEITWSRQALEESERSYRLLVNNLPNIVFKGYEDGSIDLFDDKIEKLTGYSRSDFRSRKIKWTDLIVEEDKPGAKKALIQALKTDKSYIRQYRIRKKNGETLWIEAGSQIICDQDGNIDFITGAFLDISERKEAEAALHASEEKYRSLFDSGPNPIFVLDSRTLEILDANPSAETTYGYTRKELIGRSFTDIGEVEFENQAFSEVDPAEWARSCVVSQKIRHFKKGRKPIYTEVKACPAIYNNREAIILAATDISETVEKDAQLFQASKMTTLGEMSAGIAHELNQPLNAIKIGNDFLKRMVQKGLTIQTRDLEKVATEVSAQVERASDIIWRLREFGHKPDFKKETFSVNETIRDVMRIIGHQLALQNIEVELGLDETIPAILANKNRFEQVVFNLITNARDAIEQATDDSTGDSGGKIHFRSYAEHGEVVFEVTDTGIGMDSEIRARVFEPFFTTKEVGKGMGLGLAISYQIVRDFGGQITVESRDQGGSRFTLRFPAANL